jgi:L-ascorbate metabolism protein UlaG (beta-lactamase superfamily)
MKITKYEHACFVIEQNGQKLVVDPGDWSPSLPTDLTDVVAIVITHVHGDHLDPAKIARLTAANPNLTIYGPAEALSAIDYDLKVVSAPGQEVKINDFKLDFVGTGHHAVIDSSAPGFQNVGVIINDVFYIPGDSFDLPGRFVQITAVPSSGPWVKISDAMDFIRAVRSPRFVNDHDALLSEQGRSAHFNWLTKAAESVGSTFEVVPTGGSVEVAS